MIIIRTDDFERAFARLPAEIRELCVIQLHRFSKDQSDPRLHIKKVRSLRDVFSLRITRRYRAFFYFQNNKTAIFFDIDHRKDIYR